MKFLSVKYLIKQFLFIACLGLVPPAIVHAQDDPFEDGWTLQADSSALRFQSVKNSTKVESSSFATFSGSISETGLATVKVLLDSVDTKVDLRNVRMRFLFFETFQYPEAIITAQLDEALLQDLITKRRMIINLPYTLDLHGIKKELVAEVSATLISPEIVAISTATPISIGAKDFDLETGIQKLQEAASVEITPSATVTFDFLFARNVEGGASVDASEADDDNDDDENEDDSDNPASAALETKGDFDTEACVGRFEILSRAGNIYFASGSARLNAKSNALLDNLFDIVRRCPGMVIEIGGHTDSDGSDATNQVLSERRAQSVADYLEAKGIDDDRIFVKGYGETSPAFANDSATNKSRNRRIEFKVLGG